MPDNCAFEIVLRNFADHFRLNTRLILAAEPEDN